MDYQNYEDYMREVLGYQNMRKEVPYNTYQMNPMSSANPMQQVAPVYPVQPINPAPPVAPVSPMGNEYYNMSEMGDMEETELNGMYPDIYTIVYPMVCKVCDKNENIKVTKEMLDKMVEEVYDNVEVDESQKNVVPDPVLRNGDVVNPNAKKISQTRETRQRNFLLNDFIRVLFLRELFERRRRPHFNEHGPEGGFFPGEKPPFRPRGYEGLY